MDYDVFHVVSRKGSTWKRGVKEIPHTKARVLEMEQIPLEGHGDLCRHLLTPEFRVEYSSGPDVRQIVSDYRVPDG